MIIIYNICMSMIIDKGWGRRYVDKANQLLFSFGCITINYLVCQFWKRALANEMVSELFGVPHVPPFAFLPQSWMMGLFSKRQSLIGPKKIARKKEMNRTAHGPLKESHSMFLLSYLLINTNNYYGSVHLVTSFSCQLSLMDIS